MVTTCSPPRSIPLNTIDPKLSWTQSKYSSICLFSFFSDCTSGAYSFTIILIWFLFPSTTLLLPIFFPPDIFFFATGLFACFFLFTAILHTPHFSSYQLLFTFLRSLAHSTTLPL